MKKSKKNAIRLWFGDWSSRIGNNVFDYANSILIVSLGTKATKLLAIYQSSEKIVGIAVTLFGGIVADGNKKKKICVITDFISSIVCFVVAFLCNSEEIGIYIVIANAILAILSAFNTPIYKSIIREMIEKEFIVSFNAVGRGGAEIISLVSPIIGVVLVKMIGIKGALLFDGVTFLISAIVENGLKTIKENDLKVESMIMELKDVVKYIVRDKWVLYMMGLYAATNFVFAGYNLMLPFSESMFASICENFYSKALFCEAIGALGAAFISGLVGNKGKCLRLDELSLFLAGVVLCMVPIISEFSIYALYAIYILFSACTVVYNISFTSQLQIRVAEKHLGKTISFINTVAMAVVPISLAFFSNILDMKKIESYFFVGRLLLILSILAFVLYKKKMEWEKEYVS